MEKYGPPVLVLLSGGIDSSALVHFYTSAGSPTSAVFVNYGQAALAQEQTSARNVADYYRVPLSLIDLDGGAQFKEGEIPSRNAFLLFSCLMFTGFSKGLIVMGIHSGTTYYDCSKEFQIVINSLLKGYTGGQVAFQTPFVEWTKADVVNYCRLNHVPIHLTYSCEHGGLPPCGKCRSCLDRRALDVV